MKQAVQWLLRGYKRVISPMLPHACRFVPTCSEYALEAVELHGVWRGGWLAVARLLRCHPFARAGFDPVPLSFACRSDNGSATSVVCQHEGSAVPLGRN